MKNKNKKGFTRPILVVHGGAGVISKNTTKKKIEEYLEGIKLALKSGYRVLKDGGSALDATMASVIEFENNSLYNAGMGAVYTRETTHEMDACIMDGKNLDFGASCTLKHIKNPIKLARAIMDKSPHAFLSGRGAEAFGHEHNLEQVENSFFDDAFRLAQLEKAKKDNTIVRDHDIEVTRPMGTVGAVAVNIHGSLAAATSTGGTTNKVCGRVGDTPIPGAGTYANNRTCAVSCTGFGEEFMKKVTAHDLHSRMIYGGLSLEAAAQEVVFEHLEPGSGGLIAVDSKGCFTMPYNTPGMFRGYQVSDGEVVVKIWE
ncbi:MAG: isoaspartyl peptidase/L-asparaginase [Desulfobacula sp.]|nr:isoaspartyl peptidase/L-asparaginase [Desulfobacula sp.]